MDFKCSAAYPCQYLSKKCTPEKPGFPAFLAAGFNSVLLFYGFSGVAATGSQASAAIRVKRAIV